MSRAPEAVRKQAEEANRRIEEMRNTGNEIPASENPSDENASTIEIPAPNAQPTSISAPEPQIQNNQPAQNSQNNDGYEQRYKALQGKYNAEVPRLQQLVKDLEEKLSGLKPDNSELLELKNQVRQLTEQLNQAKQKELDQSNNESLADLKDQYGDKLVDGLLKIIDSRVNPLTNQMQNLSKETKDTRETTLATQRFLAITRQLQSEGLNVDAETMNTNASFVQWLSEIDAMSGLSRKKMLNDAFWQGDINRAAMFFRTFAKQSGNSKGSSQQQNLDVENLITVDPSTSGGDPSNQSTDMEYQDEMVLRNRIREFNENRRRGKYTKEEADRLEKELFAVIGQYHKQPSVA